MAEDKAFVSDAGTLAEGSKERVLWIDYAKAIGIFLVIVGHGYYPTDGFDFFSKNFIYSFHMPLFFFISGYLFRIKETNFWLFIKNSFISLIVPYILLNLMAAIISSPLLCIQGVGSFKSKCFDFIVGGGHSFAGASWFLIAMFWIRILSYFAIKYKKKFIAVLSCLIIAYMTRRACLFDLTSAAAAFPIFMGGGICRKHNLITHIEKYKHIVCIVAFVVLCYLCYLMESVAIYSLSFGNYPYLYYIEAITGIVFFVSFCMIIGGGEKKECGHNKYSQRKHCYHVLTWVCLYVL